MKGNLTTATSRGMFWASVSILLVAGLLMTLPIISQPRHPLVGHVHTILASHTAR